MLAGVLPLPVVCSRLVLLVGPPFCRMARNQESSGMILPDGFPASCPWCDEPGITPIYVHNEKRDKRGRVVSGCGHYVCLPCSECRGPAGRWRARVAGQPETSAAA